MKDSTELHAVREGRLELGGWDIECHHIKNGQRVITQKSFAAVIGMNDKTRAISHRLTHFLNNPLLKSRKIKSLIAVIENPLSFKTRSGSLALGYEGITLIEYCKAILEARRHGGIVGDAANRHARSCEIFVVACAKTGITALIDEATGYAADKSKDEYRELFKEFIREEIREWEKEYPDQFFELIYRLYGMKRMPGNHPQFFGKFIRRYVYTPLAASNGAILDILDEKNPVAYSLGGRKYKMHQFLSDQVGLPALRGHLWQVVGIGNSVRNRQTFDIAFKRAFPKVGDQEEFDYNED